MRIIKMIMVMLFSIAIAACGGGGGSPSASAPTPKTGILTDAAVAGVAYTTSPSGLTGITDSSGAYKFNPGDTVIFKLGTLALGSVSATGIVSPLELAAGNPNKLQNLLVLFQSLNSNSSSTNTISIPPAAAAAVTTAIDLNALPATFASSANTALQSAMTAGGITTPIVNQTAANAHFLAQSMTMLSSNIWVSQPVANSAGHTVLLRFNANGEYLHGEAGADVIIGGTKIGQAGVEQGTATPASFDVNGFSLMATTTVDTNLQAGLSNPLPCDRFRSVGDQIVFTEDKTTPTTCANSVAAGTISKAENNATSIVGVWALDSATVIKTVHVAFFTDGKFLLVDPLPNTGCGKPGIESGSYTYDATAKVLKISNLAYDTNGCAGLSNSGAETPAGMSFSLSADGTTATGIDSTKIAFTMYRVSQAIAAPSPFVGTWYDGNTNREFTIFANGDYMHAKSITTNPGAFPGIEHGRYTWNATTGAFAGACPPDVDTNGTDGLSHPDGITICSGSTSTTGTVTAVNVNTVLWTVNGNPTVTLTRVVDAINPLVGSWYGGGNTNVVFTFFANGDYMMAQSVITNPSGGGLPGLEHGTYTWNSTTGAFVAACPTIDTNGTAGFSNSVGGCGTTNTIIVNGNTATFTNKTTGMVSILNRVTP